MTITLARPADPQRPGSPSTYLVRVNQLQKRRTPSGCRYIARWSVARRPKSLTFMTQALGAAFLSDLRQAAKAGEEFDLATGLPRSMSVVDRGPTLLDIVQEYLISRWSATAPRTRETDFYALAPILTTLVTVRPDRPRPEVLHAALRDHALLPPERRAALTGPQERALRWLEQASLPMSAVGKAENLRLALAAISLTRAGNPAAANTVRRKKAVFGHLLEYTVEQEIFATNPLKKIKWKAPKTTRGVVDPRTVVNPVQARRLLECVAKVGRTRGPRMRALFACMYYAALRPEELADLRHSNLTLPPDGWGLITLDSAAPAATKRWSDSGVSRESRSLKHRAVRETREIPIPPTLVALLREHLALYGTGADGRVFCTPTGHPYTSSATSRVWQEARRLALTPPQQASPLAARPYDLRHAAVSLWLNAGVPAVEVAKRAGHGLDVLLKIYAKCIDGDQRANNDRIGRVLEW